MAADRFLEVTQLRQALTRPEPCDHSIWGAVLGCASKCRDRAFEVACPLAILPDLCPQPAVAWIGVTRGLFDEADRGDYIA